MIRFKLAEQIEKKQFAEGRRLTVQEVAEATGVNRMTLSKILNHKGYSTKSLARLNDWRRLRRLGCVIR